MIPLRGKNFVEHDLPERLVLAASFGIRLQAGDSLWMTVSKGGSSAHNARYTGTRKLATGTRPCPSQAQGKLSSGTGGS
ncbi:MAG TPA: hypothetical protein VFT90_09935 [Chryseosolibacter sp.]|nr:hypothetical protein [Chryseosolibacter sp.]